MNNSMANEVLNRIMLVKPDVSISECNEHMIEYISDSNTCPFPTLVKLLELTNRDDTEVRRVVTTNYQDIEYLEVVNESDTPTAYAGIYEIGSNSYTESILANCYISLYILLNYLEVRDIQVPNNIKVEIKDA